MGEDRLKQSYDEALVRLAGMLSLQYGEVHNFCGDVGEGAWGARRLKEFFRVPEVVEQLDSIVRICEEYRGLSAPRVAGNSAFVCER